MAISEKDDIPLDVLEKHGFEYISILGYGGFGIVLKVRHKISQQYFAVKMLRKNRKADPEDILREIRAIAVLKSPNIIRYNHSFIEDGDLFLIMEYCSKGSLRDRLRKEKKLDIEFCSNLFLRLTHTFMFLHKSNFIHHDIKPDNILFTENKVKVSDFGTVNTRIGTIKYMAPETLMGKEVDNDPRGDIFSLGITFMECVTGSHPFSGLEDSDQLAAIRELNYDLDDLPYWLRQLLLKACHFDLSARFQNMNEFHEAISKRNIPQIINHGIIDSHKKALRLKSLVGRKKWHKAEEYIKQQSSDRSVNFLMYKGQYYLKTNQLKKARDTFESVVKIDQSAPIQKEMAEIYLQFNEPSKAASILHSYVNRDFKNDEAHNQLLHSYFLSDQWELGLEQTKYLRKLFPKHPAFVNNLALFEILLGKKPSEDHLLTKSNPVGYYNYYKVVKNNEPQIYNPDDLDSLKSKLIFNEFKFSCFYKSNNQITVAIDGKEFCSDKHIISIGRAGFKNVFTIDDRRVSRRHCIIINLKNDVWLYDMSTLGTYVNGVKVEGRCFLLGLCEIKAGSTTFHIKSDRDLLL